jgi:hypothetical protein
MLRAVLQFAHRTIGTPTTWVGLFRDHAVLYIGIPWAIEHACGHIGQTFVEITRLAGG